ncbi:MAG: DUF2202 domain-containing protein [Myxococcales bacterium]|nr:DUF2202 domain-containing protein [Myxococcales bacterium]
MNHRMLFLGSAIMWMAMSGCDESTSAPGTVRSGLDVSSPGTTIAGGLSEREMADLFHMREEEKLARDVYLTLADRWSLRVHENISGSEQRHMDAVKVLLDRYELRDPVGANPRGVFEDESLQKLHDELVAQGLASIEASLRVGCAIEELDIKDLQEAMAASDNQDILNVYGHLLRGSENHLRAFTGALESSAGQIYEPKYLDSGSYGAILSAAHQSGRSNARGRGAQGRPCGNGGDCMRAGNVGGSGNPADCVRATAGGRGNGGACLQAGNGGALGNCARAGSGSWGRVGRSGGQNRGSCITG